MTARQPPGEKGAKACTIGYTLSRDGYFCAYFSGVTNKKELKSMENGARYVVKTHWGVFSLDEGSYQDYLAGKLWISWKPGRQQRDEAPQDGHTPPHVTDRAIAIRELANKQGMYTTLQQQGGCSRIPYSKRFDNFSIDELNLTVRSSNGLKRANAATYGRVKALLEQENGILSVRNLGQKSAKEIELLFYEDCYARLTPYERALYWQEVLDNEKTAW